MTLAIFVGALRTVAFVFFISGAILLLRNLIERQFLPSLREDRGLRRINLRWLQIASIHR